MPLLNIGESTLYYSVKGNGVPIVFIHPPLLTSANFHYQSEDLSKEFKVITFDIRGHGKSGSSKQNITYPLIADDIVRLLDHLEIDKAYLCGYSTGGGVVLEFLLTQPGRALGGIIISGMSEVKDLYLQQKIKLAARISNWKALSLLSFAISWGNSNKREIYQKLYKEAVKGDPDNIHQYYNFSLHYNCTDQLNKIHLPVLLIYGEKDRSFHKYAQILHQKLPHNNLILLQEEKHQIPTKAAEKLNKMIMEHLHTIDDFHS
ncbi:alpha/beta fold hydrolase [Cytobacillus gottheilii]|uniref:alpha/beta fold hydrolase n=1 Tax=Cytobacillus gottheilii TaxID=859144 RepID=UPI0009B9F61D|nr:alpha/beta hydrolase [Cytobacillus gottheilii]